MLLRAITFNIVVVSIAFFFIFASYNTIQNFATSLLPGNLGNVSLSVLYSTVAVSVFFAAPIIRRWGAKWTMVAGSVTYCAYIASLIKIVPGAVLAMSVVIGFGAALLWIALGVFLTENSRPETYGAASGFFWSVFQVCNIVGNLIAYFVLQHTTAQAPLYIIFASITAVGTVGLVVLRTRAQADPALVHIQASDAGDADKPRTQCAPTVLLRESWTSMVETMKILVDRRILLLMPLELFSGIEIGFWAGEFPLLLDAPTIGLVLSLAGVGEVLGGFFFGRLGDRFGRLLSLSIGVVLYGTGLGLAGWMKAVGTDSMTPMLASAPLAAYIAAFCFGAGDSCFNTNVYATISSIFNNDTRPRFDSSLQPLAGGAAVDNKSALLSDEASAAESLLAGAHGRAVGEPEGHALLVASPAGEYSENVRAYAVFNLVQNIGSAIGFSYSTAVPLHGAGGTFTQLYVQGALMALAWLTFAWLAHSYRLHGAGRQSK